MTGSRIPRCPNRREALVLQIHPTAPPTHRLLADPPFRYVCTSANCSSPRMPTPP